MAANNGLSILGPALLPIAGRLLLILILNNYLLSCWYYYISVKLIDKLIFGNDEQFANRGNECYCCCNNKQTERTQNDSNLCITCGGHYNNSRNNTMQNLTVSTNKTRSKSSSDSYAIDKSNRQYQRRLSDNSCQQKSRNDTSMILAGNLLTQNKRKCGEYSL